MSKLFAAIDLGASSGRVIAGEFTNGQIELTEIHRFVNTPIQKGSSLFWDFEALQREITSGLSRLGVFAHQRHSQVVSIGIDTWAVDFGLISSEGDVIGGVRHYRDERNSLGVAAVLQELSLDELFGINGLQYQPFNTVFQLAAVNLQEPEVLQDAASFLLIPDLIAFWLTGVRSTERTNASTTGLLTLDAHEWNWDLIERLGLPSQIFGPLIDAGHVVGELNEEFKTHPAFASTVITAVPSHDTAAAVAGTPLDQDGTSAYLSSGTWSLLGLELDEPITSAIARHNNFTNELGAENKVRFLKNLSGLWLLQQSMAEFSKTPGSKDLVALLDEAAGIESASRIKVTDEEFASPGDMPAKIQNSCARAGLPVPHTPAQVVRCILDSLADAYADALGALEQISGVEINSLKIVGGGSQNDLLSQLTADRIHKPVSAGPIEATALGNLLTQASAHGVVAPGLEAQREIVRTSFTPKIFTPKKLGVSIGQH